MSKITKNTVCNCLISILTQYKKDKDAENAVIQFDHWISDNSTELEQNSIEYGVLLEDFNSLMLSISYLNK